MNEDSATDVGAFFDRIWGTESGYVYLPRFVKKTEEWKRSMLQWPAGRQKAIDYALAQSAEGNDVYFGPAVYSAKSPTKEFFQSSRVVWADIDGGAPTAEDWASGPSEDRRGVPEPTLRVQSSAPGREHVYWELNEPCRDIKVLEDINRAIAYTLNADIGGWDAVQVLRPAGTYHYKESPQPVHVVSDTQESFTLSSFSKLRPVKKLAMDAIHISEVPDVGWVSAKYPWDEAHYELFNQDGHSVGARSDALMRLGYFGAESLMKNEEIYSLLLDADTRWGKYSKRADREQRLVEIIARARLKYPLDTATPTAIMAAAHDTTSDDIEDETEARIAFGFQDFLEHEIRIEWAFEDLIDTTGLGIIAAAPGVGKTQISIQMGIAAALGKDFLTWKAVEPMRVLFFSLEMSHSSLSHFMRQIAKGYEDEDLALLQDNFIVIPLGQSIALDQPSGKAFMENMITEYEPKGVIIDSMGKVTTQALTDETLIRELNDYYSVVRNTYRCFMWFIHHTRKASDNNKKPRGLGDIYGNQYITTDATIVLNLWKDDKGMELSVIKNRLAEEVRPVKVKRDENLKFSLVVVEEDKPSLMTHIGGDTVGEHKPLFAL